MWRDLGLGDWRFDLDDEHEPAAHWGCGDRGNGESLASGRPGFRAGQPFAQVREFRGVMLTDPATFRFVPAYDGALPPVISGLEIVAE